MTGLKEQIRRIEKGLEKKKKKTKGMHFTSATREEIESKIGANDPWLSGLGFDDRTTPGGTVNIQVFIDNPGLATALNLYVHVWIGSGIADPSGDTFVPNVDTRFPRLTEPHSPSPAWRPAASALTSPASQPPPTAWRARRRSLCRPLPPARRVCIPAPAAPDCG
jgi:hypothetical protein